MREAGDKDGKEFVKSESVSVTNEDVNDDKAAP